MFEIQKMMGHSSIVTTEGYLRLDLKRLERDFPTLKYKSVTSEFRDTHFRDTDNNHFAYVEGNSINQPLLWEQEIGSSNLSTPTLEILILLKIWGFLFIVVSLKGLKITTTSTTTIYLDKLRFYSCKVVVVAQKQLHF